MCASIWRFVSETKEEMLQWEFDLCNAQSILWAIPSTNVSRYAKLSSFIRKMNKWRTFGSEMFILHEGSFRSPSNRYHFIKYSLPLFSIVAYVSMPIQAGLASRVNHWNSRHSRVTRSKILRAKWRTDFQAQKLSAFVVLFVIVGKIHGNTDSILGFQIPNIRSLLFPFSQSLLTANVKIVTCKLATQIDIKASGCRKFTQSYTQTNAHTHPFQWQR